MTFQARSFAWSIGIHGLIVLGVIVVQFSASTQTRVAVIDFTLGDTLISSTDQQEPPQQIEAPRQKAKRPAPRPSEEIKEVNVPSLETQIPRPSQVSIYGKEVSASTPEVVQGASPTSVTSHSQTAGTAGTGATVEQVKATYLKEHFAYIRDRITGSISYPYAARKRGWHGQVKIAFVICEDGGVIDVRVIDSCGFSVLDGNAVDTVKKVAPFPRPPSRAEIRMVINYRLD
jgi:periplasmic protein TonB